MAQTFTCSVVTPEAEMLDDQVVYASIPAWDGQVGLAFERAPLLVKLGDGPLRLDMPDGKSRWFFVGGGFAQMKDNKLTLLTDETIPVEKIDRDEVEASYKEADARIAVGETDAAIKNRQLQRARVMRELIARSSH